jgi:hypothetical protein
MRRKRDSKRRKRRRRRKGEVNVLLLLPPFAIFRSSLFYQISMLTLLRPRAAQDRCLLCCEESDERADADRKRKRGKK